MAVIVLTIVTQVGGIVYLFCLLVSRRWSGRTRYPQLARWAFFAGVYLLTTFMIVPLLAPLFGRVPLPVYGHQNVRPVNIFTCLLNRHYVTPTLKSCVLEAGEKISKSFPGISVNYMDACFPFIDKFPLIPHLSHFDGKKVDIAFYYQHHGRSTNENPSIIGYGASEGPRQGEQNTPALCASQGYWQYSLLSGLIPLRDGYDFDAGRTRRLLNLFASDVRVSRIFLEPHLRDRLSLTNSKFRFHGCRAVRHDDHLHVEVR